MIENENGAAAFVRKAAAFPCAIGLICGRICIDFGISQTDDNFITLLSQISDKLCS